MRIDYLVGIRQCFCFSLLVVLCFCSEWLLLPLYVWDRMLFLLMTLLGQFYYVYADRTTKLMF